MPFTPKKLIALAAAAAALSWSALAQAGTEQVKLSGANEVPPVTTEASGSGSITVTADGAVSGSVTTTGVAGTMAHIHMAPGKKANGPVIIPLTQTSPGVWSVPAGAKLSPEQMKAYAAGDLYINVHSEQHKAGEIRADLMP